MPVEIAYPHVEKLPDAPARLERFPRVRVAQVVMDYIAHGWSAQEMCRQHAHLRPAEIHAALAYYFDHQIEIDREIEAELEQIEASDVRQSSPFFIRMQAKGIL